MAKRLLLLFCWAALASARLASPTAAYIADDRWSTTATNGFIASSSPPTPGVPATITWSFAPDGTLIPGNTSGSTLPSNLISFLDDPDNWGPGPGGTDYTLRPWFPIFQQSFDRLSALSGVTYVYEPNDNGVSFTSGSSGRGVLGVRGDVRLGGKSYGAGSNTLASNFFPDFGEMMINTDQASFFTSSSNSYRRFRNTLMHEAMHGLGISHVESSSSGFLIEPTLSTAFDGPQLDDVLAIQRLYREKGGGNDSTARATPLGTVPRGQSRSIGTLGNSTVISSTQTDFVSIDDDSDIDFFSFTIDEPLDVRLVLTPKGTTYQVGPQNGTQSAFNSLAVSNLSLALFAPNGTTLLSGANANAAGLGESVVEQLDPGTYFARVTGAQNNIQLYQLSVLGNPVGPANLIWAGNISPTWNVNTTANFKNGAAADEFQHLDNVTFNSTAITTAVNIEGDVAPGSMIVQTSASYVFSGSGGIVGGAVTVNGSGVVELANSGNSYAGTTSVQAGTLKITGDANAMVSPITVSSGATLVLDAADASAMASTIAIQPGGTLAVGAAGSDANVFPDNPAGIVNDGVIRVFDSERISQISGGGQIVVESESSEFSGNSAFNGQINVKNEAAAEVGDNQAFGTGAGGTVVENGGAVLVDIDAELSETLTLSGQGDGSGALRVGPGRQAALLGDITLNDNAKLQVGAAAAATFAGSVEGTTGNPPATLDVLDGAVALFTGPVALGGGLVKSGAGTAELAGSFSSGGVSEIEAGVLALSGAGMLEGEFHIHDGATMLVANSQTFASSARLAGDGEVVGNFNFPGIITPGASAGALSVTGDLTLEASATLQIELGGLAPSLQFDQLHVSGVAELGAGLEVSLIDAFVPTAGNAFSILTAGEIVKQFQSLTLPELSLGLLWELHYSPTEVILSVGGSPLDPADFDEDGAVEADDLARWQANFGVTGSATRPDGDADGDFAVDGADFLIWQRNLNMPAGALVLAEAVPEPAAWMLLMAAAVLAAPFRRAPLIDLGDHDP